MRGKCTQGISANCQPYPSQIRTDLRRLSNFKEKGFLISKKRPFLSASVDNIQKCQCSDGCQNKVLEHKCPWKQNNMHPKEVFLTPKIGDIVSENGFTLKPSSQYYFQLQLQMFVSELPLNVWVVWTEQVVFTVEVPFYPNFMTKVCLL